jgi:hypothetical protein
MVCKECRDYIMVQCSVVYKGIIVIIGVRDNEFYGFGSHRV